MKELLGYCGLALRPPPFLPHQLRLFQQISAIRIIHDLGGVFSILPGWSHENSEHVFLCTEVCVRHTLPTSTLLLPVSRFFRLLVCLFAWFFFFSDRNQELSVLKWRCREPLYFVSFNALCWAAQLVGHTPGSCCRLLRAGFGPRFSFDGFRGYGGGSRSICPGRQAADTCPHSGRGFTSEDNGPTDRPSARGLRRVGVSCRRVWAAVSRSRKTVSPPGKKNTQLQFVHLVVCFLDTGQHQLIFAGKAQVACLRGQIDLTRL